MKLVDLDPDTCSTTAAEADSSDPLLEERVPARQVAKLLGIQIGTLAKWRYLDKGPKGWLRISPTCVVYPISEIRRFLAERTGAKGGEK
jgi:hypothetical protein